MDRIEEIRAKIGECDDIIIEQLAVRMSHIQEIISYKKRNRYPDFTAGAGEETDRRIRGKTRR